MAQLDGMLTPAQTILFADSLATPFRYSWEAFGLDATSETTTLSHRLDAARLAILGDGSTSYGLGSPAFQNSIFSALNALVRRGRYDVFYQQAMQGLAPKLDDMVRRNLPPGWKFATSANQIHQFDMFLSRLNGVSVGTPATPAAAGVLAAINTSGGALPAVTAGNAPFLYHTLVGATDQLESLPSPEATRVAIGSTQNGYTYTIAGTVPAGVTKVRTYRTNFLGASGTEVYAQDTPVTPGAGYPVITLANPDALLFTYLPAPAWLSCLMNPEFAAEWALSNATAQNSPTRNGVASPPIFAANGMLSPMNVALGPSYLGVIGASIAGDRYMGVGNQVAGTIFDTATISGVNAFTHVAGAFQAVNMAGSNIQGFAGATGLQFRVKDALTGGTLTSVTISYHYLDAAHGQALQGPVTVTSGACSGTAAGSVCTIAVTAGRLVKDAIVTAVACSATGGDGVLEATPVR